MLRALLATKGAMEPFGDEVSCDVAASPREVWELVAELHRVPGMTAKARREAVKGMEATLDRLRLTAETMRPA